ncbi:MAG: hypothetical protein WA906_05370 [Pacificimonas sp.]
MTETLKWGQPAYLTEASKVGTTIRLGVPKNTPDACGLFVHCGTSLVEEYRVSPSDGLTFEGNRAAIFGTEGNLPKAELRHAIRQALTYKRR